ncbi:MAG: riboflavin synthase, partial [Lachnospirales bacterium]
SGSPLKISCKTILEDVHIGDSIAVNGACLTVTNYSDNSITLDVMAETFYRTNLRNLKIGSRVNLERAMAAKGRFGGHIVTGHIDGTGRITAINKDGISIWYTISADNNLLKYIVEKGSVTLDGISLTVAYVSNIDFKVSVIPHTQQVTTLIDKKVGDLIDIENDILGKYIEKFVTTSKKDSVLNFDYLSENGF